MIENKYIIEYEEPGKYVTNIAIYGDPLPYVSSIANDIGKAGSFNKANAELYADYLRRFRRKYARVIRIETETMVRYIPEDFPDSGNPLPNQPESLS